ncbi:MAG: monovalent cation:proton antiporter-2 (CPA2) family protein [Burkholderiales bacterium]
MHSGLQNVLILLAAAVLVVVAARRLKLPTILGYLVVGVLIGPHAFGWIGEVEEARGLAEYGVVFLMFSIGLEFSLPRLVTMRRIVFGLGGAQVGFTIVLVLAGALALGLTWQVGLTLGGVLAMSSTAIVTKLLAEKLQVATDHGRQVVGVLLFQDLAVVPLLILIPALAIDPAQLPQSLTFAALKAALVLGVLLFVGQRLMRGWFHIVARAKSPELFVLNVLLITLGLAYVTELAGLSMALGAFVAGMLISETEYRYQVEDDIKPFRDVLLGLFFVTVGMLLNPQLVWQHWWVVVLLVVAIFVGKSLLIAGLTMLFGVQRGAALRTGLDLAQGGEFGFVLLGLGTVAGVLAPQHAQPVLAAVIISMLFAPFVIERSERIARHYSGAEWMARAMELTRIASQSMAASQHVVICGYGRSGQNLARLLKRENISFIALDHDPLRVREAAAAGESVVFGDATRREVLVAAGLPRAKAMVISVADTELSLRVLAQVREARPGLPVIVRTAGDVDIERLREAGAAEVVADIMEGSLMLASHAFMLLGVPLSRVLAHIRRAREERYALFKGFFHGASDEQEDAQRPQPRLHSVTIAPGAAAIGRPVAKLGLDTAGVELKSLRRHGAPTVTPEADTRVEAGDVLVLLGEEENLAAAEIRLLQG